MFKHCWGNNHFSTRYKPGLMKPLSLRREKLRGIRREELINLVRLPPWLVQDLAGKLKTGRDQPSRKGDILRGVA